MILECWDSKQDNRPTALQVVTRLQVIMPQKNTTTVENQINNFEEGYHLSKKVQCNSNVNTSINNSLIEMSHSVQNLDIKEYIDINNYNSFHDESQSIIKNDDNKELNLTR